MLTLEDVAAKYSLTMSQVSIRLKRLRGAVKLKRGEHGRLLLDDAALSTFDRLLQLERSGLSVNQAAEQIKNELGILPVESTAALTEHIKDLQARVAEQSNTIEYLKAELNKCWDATREQQQRTLPNPERSWWLRWLGPRTL